MTHSAAASSVRFKIVVFEEIDLYYPYSVWLDEAEPLSSPKAGPQFPPTPESAPPSFSAYHELPLTPTPNVRKRGFASIVDETFGSASSPSQKRVKLLEAARTKGCDEEGQYSSSSFLHNPDIGSQCTQETFTGENTEELSANSIETLLQSLGNIPAYVKKLERRKIAAEKSRDAKANKIASLEAEVERYSNFDYHCQLINRSIG